MAETKKFVCVCIGTVLLFCILQYATAANGRPEGSNQIKCYQCNSFYDKGCADFFDNRTYPLKPCNNNATMCRKIIQETYFDGHWDIRYIRQCATLGEVSPDEGRWCKERTGTFRVKTKYCHCDNKDGCNTAATISNHGWTSVIGALVLTTWNIWPYIRPDVP